ncbi:MAG: bifunctional DNA-formamidopyrimidine glycosylase/DNA-(apurinic or apyrimidinic site) lyase [bacterium]
MPELPEVETIRRDLNKKIVGKNISDIKVRKNKMVIGSTKSFIASLKGRKFTKIDRRGKLMIFNLDKKDLFLLAHLKMTGQLIFKKKNQITAGGHSGSETNLELPNKFSHIIITFSDKSQLFFNDMRQFGYMKLVNEKDKDLALTKFGLEPLTKNFQFKDFGKVFKNKKSSLKAVLLNQKLIAGLGNIYVDEICFRAKVLPTKKVYRISQKKITELFKATNYIIKKAIQKRGTTFNDYVDADGKTGNFIKYLKVYQRAGETCLRCKKVKIKKVKSAGRGTHLCPYCQK